MGLPCDEEREIRMAEQTVSVREFKNRLGYYLQMVRRGESVVITRRGVVVGRMVPPDHSVGERVRLLCETEQVLWSGHKIPIHPPVASVREGASVAQILVEDRR